MRTLPSIRKIKIQERARNFFSACFIALVISTAGIPIKGPLKGQANSPDLPSAIPSRSMPGEQDTGFQSCQQAPINPRSLKRYDLDDDYKDWGASIDKGSPTCIVENVSDPSMDRSALRTGITGGSPYSDAHFYAEFLSEPTAIIYLMKLSFRFSPTTTCNEPSSVVQAIEFSMSKWYQGKRYEFSLQWENVDDGSGVSGAPQWRYWDGADPTIKWKAFPSRIGQCLKGEEWHTFELGGKIIGDHIHYNYFIIDNVTHSIDITVSPVGTTGEDDRESLAIQLDGNFEEAPYDVYIDNVLFVRGSSANLLYLPLFMKE
jgi:hypothetical protein